MATVKRTLPPAPHPTQAYKTEAHEPYTDIVKVREEFLHNAPKTRKYRIFTNEERTSITDAFDSGKSLDVLARMWDTTTVTVQRIVEREHKKRADSAATPSAQSK